MKIKPKMESGFGGLLMATFQVWEGRPGRKDGTTDEHGSRGDSSRKAHFPALSPKGTVPHEQSKQSSSSNQDEDWDFTRGGRAGALDGMRGGILAEGTGTAITGATVIMAITMAEVISIFSGATMTGGAMCRLIVIADTPVAGRRISVAAGGGGGGRGGGGHGGHGGRR